MEANGINYYKGVLLCSRPNQTPSINKPKQFCGRVFAHQQLGLVPIKQFNEKKTKKRVLPVLNNHKKWLQSFKKDIHHQKEQQQKQKDRAIKRLQKIKEQGLKQRQKLKNTTIQQSQKQLQNTKQQPKQSKNPNNFNKKQKPAWAKTAKEIEQTQEKEVDQLIDFFNTQKQTELKDYLNDEEIKNIMIHLKQKIQNLKEKEDWRDKQLRRMEQNKGKQSEQKQKDDVLSRISKQSGAQSIASHKTAERVEELQKKKNQVQWDNLTKSQKKSMASVDEQIAKNIADEVLRNYPALKHHSNQSIRKLIQKHAHDEIKS